MRRPGFILVIDSYLVRKGMVSILNRIQGITILQEFGNANSLDAYLKKQSVDFIIISQSVFDDSSDAIFRDAVSVFSISPSVCSLMISPGEKLGSLLLSVPTYSNLMDIPVSWKDNH